MKRLEERLEKQGSRSRHNETKILSDKENNFSSKLGSDKENMSILYGNNEPLSQSTPVRSNKKPQRL